jgi:hypothetical protein
MNQATAELRRYIDSSFDSKRHFQLLPVMGKQTGAANRYLIVTSSRTDALENWSTWYTALLNSSPGYYLPEGAKSVVLNVDQLIDVWDQKFRHTWRGRFVDIDCEELAPADRNSIRALNETLITYWVVSVEYNEEYGKFFPLVSCHPTLYGPNDMTSGYTTPTETSRHLKNWFFDEPDKGRLLPSEDDGWFRNLDTYSDVLVGYFNRTLRICRIGDIELASRTDLGKIDRVGNTEFWSKSALEQFFQDFEIIMSSP